MVTAICNPISISGLPDVFKTRWHPQNFMLYHHSAVIQDFVCGGHSPGTFTGSIGYKRSK